MVDEIILDNRSQIAKVLSDRREVATVNNVKEIILRPGEGKNTPFAKVSLNTKREQRKGTDSKKKGKHEPEKKVAESREKDDKAEHIDIIV